jgi:hypothetical protein
MSTVLVVVIALVAILPLVAHAIPVWGDNPRYSGGAPPPPPSNTGSSGSSGGSSGGSGSGGSSGNGGSGSNNGSTSTTTSSKTVTLTNTTTTYTITKTYTQVVTKTYVVNHYIEYYMYPIIKWVFTLVNIGSQQAPGYHMVGSEKLFTPGFGGGSGIFVPVYAQEAIYTLNIAPSTKPVITGWYVGSTSQSSSPPQLASQSVDTYLSGIQETVNTIQNQTKVTLTNTTTIINNVFMYWNTKPGSNNTQVIHESWSPFFYSPQDIQSALNQSNADFIMGSLNLITADYDLLHGNSLGAANSILNGIKYYGYGAWNALRAAGMVGWNTFIATPAQWTVDTIEALTTSQTAYGIANTIESVAEGATLNVQVWDPFPWSW